MSSLWLHQLITSGLAVCECVCLNCCHILHCQFLWERNSDFISVCACVHAHSMSHLQTQKPRLWWRLMFTHSPSTEISLLFLFHLSIFLLSPSPLDSHTHSLLPLFPSPTLLCLWLTSSVGYLAGWLSESDIWIYYYTTLQVSSLCLSAPIACPCFPFPELSGLMSPCACCPSRWLLPHIGENDSSVLSHRRVMGKRGHWWTKQK